MADVGRLARRRVAATQLAPDPSAHESAARAAEARRGDRTRDRTGDRQA